MTEGENILLSVPEYTQVVKRELAKILKNDEEKMSQCSRLAEVFADFDRSQTLAIDKFDLAAFLGSAGIKISKKKARELSITLETKQHGEVCLDEVYSLFSSINLNNGMIGLDCNTYSGIQLSKPIVFISIKRYKVAQVS